MNNYKNLIKYGKNIISGYIGDFIMGSHMFEEMINRRIDKSLDRQMLWRIIINKEGLQSYEISKSVFSDTI